MKIGIITYWQSNDNYGQLLQCWALQQYLKDKGHQPYLIRYDFINRTLPVNKWKKVLKLLLVYPALRAIWRKSKLKSVEDKIASLTIKNKERRFDKFRDDRIEQSKVVYHSLAELRANPPQADAYITGSDQVWSQLLNIKENEVFFLNFGDSATKRISYAASFAMDEYPLNLYAILKDNLSRFDAISVREKAGVDICKNVGSDSKMVLDPTLLLDSANYRKIETPKREGEYVYIYSLNVRTADEMYFKEVSTYAEQNNCKIVVTPASGCVLGEELFEGVEYDYAPIPAWLSNIDHAKLVVSTSFHGVVFCVLMHTPFVYIPLKGELSKMNNRIGNLLTALRLVSHIASDKEDFDEIANQNINWKDVDERINALRQESYEFLEKSILGELQNTKNNDDEDISRIFR